MSNYRIEYNSGSYWSEYGSEKSRAAAIQLAQDLEAQGGEFDWPYRVVNGKTGQEVWPPEAIQYPLFEELTEQT